MNKDCLSRTTSNISPNSHPQFFIRNSEINYADITFVEKVLAILIESRFGPGFEYQKLEKPSDLPDFEPVLFSDPLDADMTVSFWDARYSGRNVSVNERAFTPWDAHAVSPVLIPQNSQGRKIVRAETRV